MAAALDIPEGYSLDPPSLPSTALKGGRGTKSSDKGLVVPIEIKRAPPASTAPTGPPAALPSPDVPSIDAAPEAPPEPPPQLTPDAALPPGYSLEQPQQGQPRQPDLGDYAADVGHGALSGVVSGVEGLAGVPSLPFNALDWVSRKVAKILNPSITDAELDRRKAAAAKTTIGALTQAPGQITNAIAAGAKQGIDALTSGVADFKPLTQPGRLAKAVGEFVPGALTGGTGSIASKLVKYAAVPGIASEAAPTIFHATPAGEPYVRAIAGLLAGGAAGYLMRPGASDKYLAGAFKGVPVNESRQYIQAAGDLMRNNPVTLTWPEALHTVSGGRINLTNAQRVLEGHGRLQQVMADRPAQVQRAVGQQLGRIEPTPTPHPETLGPAAGQEAQGVITDTSTAINAQARPHYFVSDQTRVHPSVTQQFGPVYERNLARIRADDELSATIANRPDNSGAAIDLTQREMGQRAEEARIPGHADSSNVRAMNLEQARQAPIAALEHATGSRPATATTPRVIGHYERARQIEAELRQQLMEPLMHSPIGRMAGRDTDVQKAISALFPDSPVAGGERAVGDAIRHLSQRGERGAWAARGLVRAYVEGVFNAAKPDLSGPARSFGGARFRNMLEANPQVAANLHAALEALPNGQHIVPGFERLMRTLEATGERQRAGSQTTFNQAIRDELKAGGPMGTAASLLPLAKIPAAIREKYGQWAVGQNLDQIADLMVNPEAGRMFEQLAAQKYGSPKAMAIAVRLMSLAGQGLRHRPQAQPQ
jgi:hypothetical protein